MKHSILIVLALGAAIAVGAQTAGRWQVLAAQGATDRNERVQVNWTLGEPATSAGRADAVMLTEGFQQPDPQYTIVAETTPPDAGPADGRSVLVFPNPTTGLLRVILEDTGARLTQIALLDDTGRLLTEQRVLTPATRELDLSPYPSGIFLLRIQSADNLYNEVYQVIKQK